MQNGQRSKRKFTSLEDESETNISNIRAPIEATQTTSHNNDSPIDNQYCTDLLTTLRNITASDHIHKCTDIDLRFLIEKADEYFLLADEKLHIFPFKDVELCWLRLYTDASVVRAIKLIQQHHEHGTITNALWLDQVIHLLDMAMIMTGGLGRTEMITRIYENLEAMLSQAPCDDSKGRLDELLSTEDCSIPRLSNRVKQTLHNPSLMTFQMHMQKQKSPMVLTGILEDWPAISRWRSTDYWKRITLGGRRLVPVEVGRSYVDDDWGQQIIPFSEFLEGYIMNHSDKKGYLAQYDLFHHLPSLNKDIATPDYCYLDAPLPDPDTPVAKAQMKGGFKRMMAVEDDEVQKHIWFGPAWTISPLHHDPYHNILCQIVGKKYIRLYSPQQSSSLFPRSETEPAPHGEGTIDMSNTSSVDIAAMEVSPDEDWNEQWPGIGKASYEEVILEAGQALYIPVGWWHYVRSCSVGISVSFWWS